MPVGLDGAHSEEALDTTNPAGTDDWLAQNAVQSADIDTRLELVFVDENTPDYQLLVEDLEGSSTASKRVEVVIIRADEDGISKISETLADYNNIDAMHLVSHGSDGIVNIGNTSLNADTLSANESAIAEWGDACLLYTSPSPRD